MLHVWFARDKGANYGFCEVASQEAGQKNMSETRAFARTDWFLVSLSICFVVKETERALQLDGMLVLGWDVVSGNAYDYQPDMMNIDEHIYGAV